MTVRLEPVVNNEECEKIIAGSYLGVLVMCVDNTPYAIPMNHAYEDGFLYFHCAIHGRKLEYIGKNPLVSYVIQAYRGPAEEFSKRCHAKWESVLINGVARILLNDREFDESFKTFVRYHGKKNFEPSDSNRQGTRMIKVEVTDMSARREHEKDVFDFYRWERRQQG
jgi:nitroimidazol reductase NimA-like FMN-containing flavoprotein (pyridoxamine 5'-phosphate oxidase superfamily)